jgi:hypothetical protein
MLAAVVVGKVWYLHQPRFLLCAQMICSPGCEVRAYQNRKKQCPCDITYAIPATKALSCGFEFPIVRNSIVRIATEASLQRLLLKYLKANCSLLLACPMLSMVADARTLWSCSSPDSSCTCCYCSVHVFTVTEAISRARCLHI